MCRQLFLLSRRPLPPVRGDRTLPGLAIRELSSDDSRTEGVRRVAPAPFVYSVSPAGLCGCYFGYADRSSFEDANHDKAMAAADVARNGEDRNSWVDQESRDAVRSFGRYAARHADAGLALYAVWENMEGSPLEEQDTVLPSFFGGASFGPLNDNTLLTIAPGPLAR